MCIKIINNSKETPYDCSKPLEDQIKGADRIVVDYEPFDKSMDKFLEEVERFSRTGVDAKLSITVLHNDNIFGFKTKQKLKRCTSDMMLNDIIKLMALSHCAVDKKLEDLANTFAGIKTDEQPKA